MKQWQFQQSGKTKREGCLVEHTERSFYHTSLRADAKEMRFKPGPNGSPGVRTHKKIIPAIFQVRVSSSDENNFVRHRRAFRVQDDWRRRESLKTPPAR